MGLRTWLGLKPSLEERYAVAEQNRAAAARTQALTDVTNRMKDHYNPIANASQALSREGYSNMAYLLGIVGNERQSPYQRQVFGMDQNTMLDRANLAGQTAMQPFSNAVRNAKRSMGASGVLAGSGDLNSRISGAELAMAKAGSQARTQTLANLQNIDDASRLRQREMIDTDNYRYAVNEQNRALQDRIALSQTAMGSLISNPAWQAEINLANNNYDARVGSAQTLAQMNPSGMGTRFLGNAANTYLGKWFG